MWMKDAVSNIFEKLFCEIPELEVCRESIWQAFDILKECYLHNKKIMVCGNGGSASDSEHIVGELMKGFNLERRICEKDREKLKALYTEDGEEIANCLQGALPAISLVSQTSLSTAYLNDISADMVFAQQVYGYSNSGDVLVGISTSGNSVNVIKAVKVARAFEVKTIGLTGKDGGALKEICDVCICVPGNKTYRVQEYHVSVYHALCAMLEIEFFG